MWGTSSSEEKLAGDPGNAIEATWIGGRRSDFFTAGKLAPGNFGLLQQYLPTTDIEICKGIARRSLTAGAQHDELLSRQGGKAAYLRNHRWLPSAGKRLGLRLNADFGAGSPIRSLSSPVVRTAASRR